MPAKTGIQLMPVSLDRRPSSPRTGNRRRAAIKLSCLSLTVFAAIGCQDAVGPAGSCRDAMRSIERSEGSPHSESTREDPPGDYTAQWIYRATSGEPGRVYTFRWGQSYERCEMSGPARLNLIPLG
jgi:hypothetical protein